MSRRPDTKAAQNLQTIKGLLKLETNKVCADCKKSKHPRWASWNLGVFVCIRCSGIHRGMGTHISRVKSVDLDAWTDEQLQSIVAWGNMRANKYWEAKLAPGHVPSDAKIENFIRTKYESKRWVMDGPIPDPSTLGDDGAGDNVPLNVVRDRAQQSSSRGGTPTSSTRVAAPAARAQPTQLFDLMGDDTPEPPPPRPSTTDPPAAAARPPPPKPSTPSQLLGGLDFLGGQPERPSSAGQKSGGMSRPDLKQSILSLYAAAPKPQPQSPPTQSLHDRQPSFGGMSSPPAGGSAGGGFGGMNDAFAGLSFGASSQPASKPAQQQSGGSAFGGLGQMSPPAQGNFGQPQQSGMSAFGGMGQPSPPVKSNPAPPQMSSPPLSGGGFFDAGPKPPPKPNQPKQSPGPSLAVRKTDNVEDAFGDFSSGTAPAPKATSSAAPASTSPGLLDFTQTMVNIQPIKSNTANTTNTSSVFNLSSPQQKSPPAQAPAPTGSVNYASKMSTDPWGSNEWASPDPAPPKKPSVSSPPISSGGGDFGWGSSAPTGTGSGSNAWAQPASTSSFSANTAGGWGDDGGFGSGGGSSSFSQPKVAAEEDFGGWGSSNTTQSTSTAPAPSADVPKFGGSDDLFSNVWG